MRENSEEFHRAYGDNEGVDVDVGGDRVGAEKLEKMREKRKWALESNSRGKRF